MSAGGAFGESAGRLLGEVTVLDDVGPARRGRVYPTGAAAAGLLLPGALLLGGLVVWPVLRTLHASVTDEETGTYVGLDHFRAALAAEGAWTVVGRTLLWAAVVPAAVTVLGYLLALAARGRTPDGRLVRLVLVAPIALPLVVTGVVFRLLYDPDPDRGTVTGLARLIGTPLQPLGSRLITVSLMSAFVWAWVGLAFVVFRATLQAIPPDLADAVRAHGGTWLDVFRDARWRPLLRRTAAIVFALVALATSRTFDLILVMAPGSVVDEASVLALRVWQTSGGSTSGPGAALGTLWLVAVALGVLVAAVGSRQAWPPPASPVAPDPPAISRAGHVVPALVALVWVLPLGVLVATSLHDRLDASTRGWWAAPVRLDSYREVVADGQLVRSLVFTGLLAGAAAVAVLGVAVLAAYPLAGLAARGGQLAGVALLGTAVVPVQVVAGPINEVLGVVGLGRTVLGLALVHVALGVPFAVLVLRNAFADMPAERFRRARQPAARRRVVRAAAPALVAVAVLEFVQVWNDLVVGLLFSGPDAAPLGLLLNGQARQFVSNSGALAASSVLAAVLPVVLVVAFRRQIIAGLVSGTIK